MGNLGFLIRAAQKFDETRGFKFIKARRLRIRQSILQAISRAKPYRSYALELLASKQIDEGYRKLRAGNLSVDSCARACRYFGHRCHKVQEAMGTNGKKVSVDAPFRTTILTV